MSFKKKCVCCGTEFTSNQSKALYCSRSCQQKEYLARKKSGEYKELFFITYPDGTKEELYMTHEKMRAFADNIANQHNMGRAIHNSDVYFYELKPNQIKNTQATELAKEFNLTHEQSLQARIIQLEYKLKGMEQMHQNELEHIRAMHQAELLRKDQEIEKIRNDKEAENTQKLISGLLNGGLFSNQI